MISFKPLEEEDFELLNTWINMDFVSNWYDRRKFIFDNVEKKYRFERKDYVLVDSFIVQIDSIPIGYIQKYTISDYFDYAACMQVSFTSVGIDMFIGEKAYMYKGFGKDIVKQFIIYFIFPMPNSDQVIASPDPRDKAAISMYEKAGFTYLKTVMCGENGHKEYVMILRKSKDNIIYPAQSSDATLSLE